MNKIFFLIATFGVFSVYSSENKPVSIKKSVSYQNIFLMPLDFKKKPPLALNVSIPKGFVTLQSAEQFMKNWQDPIIEYIPEGENIHDWSEIITVNKSVADGYAAKEVSEGIKKALISKNKEGKVIFNSSSKEKSIERSSFILHYKYENIHEVIGASYFSGPCGLAGAQYTIRLKNDRTLADAVHKIETFFKNSFEITTVNLND